MSQPSGVKFALGTDNEDVLAQAVALAAAGVPVFPVHGLRDDGECTCGDVTEGHRKNRGKHPATARGHHDATTDEHQLAKWFKDSRLNLGFPTGQASGIVVIDVDVRNDGDRTLDDWESWVHDVEYPPPTLRCRTGGGGLHLPYRVPPGVRVGSKQAVLPGIDVKGDGGYVVTAPSRHISGARYRWIDPAVLVAVAPSDLLHWLVTVRGTAGSAGGGGVTAAGYSFESALRDGCPAGARDSFFNDLAFRCRTQWGLTQDQALERVRREWERCESTPADPFDWMHAEFKVLRVYADSSLAPPELPAWMTTIATRWLTGTLEASAGSTKPAESPVQAGQEETAESLGAVGSSGQSAGGEPPERPPGPAVLGEPPAFERDLTQTGNAHRFVGLFGEQVLSVPGVGWHLWSGSHWRFDERDDAFHLTHGVLQAIQREQEAAAGDEDRARSLRRWFETSSSMSARAAMLTGAATDPRVKATVDELNSDPWQLVVENGTLDLASGVLRPSRPGDRNTQRAAVAYDEAARCPRWEEHVELVTRRSSGASDPGLAAFIRRWVGYTLTGLVSEQKLFFGHGGGNNGKNVLIETIMELMGTYAIKQTSRLVLGSGQEHETIIADLAGARMVFIDETPKGKVNDSRLKELTGSKRIRARRIARDSFEFHAKFKLWLSGNNKPRVDDSTEGFWRRVDLVPFDVEIPPERRVKDYGRVLRAEWSGILNWALEGLKDYREVGLGRVDRVAEAVQEYRDEENWFGQFVADTFDVESREREWIPNRVIMRLLTAWCQARGVKNVPTMMQISKGDLERCGFANDPRKRRVAVWPSDVATPERGWLGPVALQSWGGGGGCTTGSGSGTGSGTAITGL